MFPLQSLVGINKECTNIPHCSAVSCVILVPDSLPKGEESGSRESGTSCDCQAATAYRIDVEILQDIEGPVCLMGNVLVHGKSREEHDMRLMVVLQKLQEAGLTLKQKKCEFSKSRVNFLGQIVEHAGVRPDPARLLP